MRSGVGRADARRRRSVKRLVPRDARKAGLAFAPDHRIGQASEVAQLGVALSGRSDVDVRELRRRRARAWCSGAADSGGSCRGARPRCVQSWKPLVPERAAVADAVRAGCARRSRRSSAVLAERAPDLLVVVGALVPDAEGPPARPMARGRTLRRLPQGHPIAGYPVRWRGRPARGYQDHGRTEVDLLSHAREILLSRTGDRLPRRAPPGCITRPAGPRGRPRLGNGQPMDHGGPPAPDTIAASTPSDTRTSPAKVGTSPRFSPAGRSGTVEPHRFRPPPRSRSDPSRGHAPRLDSPGGEEAAAPASSSTARGRSPRVTSQPFSGSQPRQRRRTLFDLASILSARELRKRFEQAEYLEALDRARLRELLTGARGRKGLGSLRALADFAPLPLSRIRSELERIILTTCRTHSLPIPAVNVPVLGYEVDFLWPEARFVVEADGGLHKGKQRDSDNARDIELARAGYLVRRYSEEALSDEQAVSAEIIDILRERLPAHH